LYLLFGVTIRPEPSREGDELGARGRDGHELDDNVRFARRDVRNPRGGILTHELDLRVVVEQAFGQDAGHGDVHAGQVAFVVLEVPRRVGAAGADNELAAVERGAQHALRRCLRGRLLGIEHRARGENGASRGAKAEHIAALHEAVHVSSS
jgi:hypothetical protein